MGVIAQMIGNTPDYAAVSIVLVFMQRQTCYGSVSVCFVVLISVLGFVEFKGLQRETGSVCPEYPEVS